MSGNIKRYKFVDAFENGRKLKFGGMEFEFIFHPSSVTSAVKDVTLCLEDLGLEHTKDYTIPPWNFKGSLKNPEPGRSIIITFRNEETYIMSKLSIEEHE